MSKVISDAQKAKLDYKRKLSEIKKSRKLKSWRPVKVYGELRDMGSKKYSDDKQKEVNAKKAAEIAKILRVPDTTYIEFILKEQEPNTITISEFVTNATNNKYRGLTSGKTPGSTGLQGGVPYYLPGMLDMINTPSRKSKTSELRDLIPMLSELNVQTPSKPMFSDMVTDYVPRNTTMSRRKDELAEYMDKYAQLTNEYNTSKVNFEKKLNMLKKNWGDELGMDKQERKQHFEPFLRDTIPLMEVKSKDYDIPNRGMYDYPQVQPKYSKFKLNPGFIE